MDLGLTGVDNQRFRRYMRNMAYNLKDIAARNALGTGLMPIPEVARRAGVSRMTAWRWAQQVGYGDAESRAYDALWKTAIDKAREDAPEEIRAEAQEDGHSCEPKPTTAANEN